MNPESVPLGKRLRRAWKRTRRKVVGVSLRGLIRVISLTPFSVSRRVLPFLTGIFARPLVSRQILQNLDYAYGDSLGRQEKKDIVRKICRNLGYSAAETLALFRGRLGEGDLEASATVDKVGPLLAEGKGLILVTAHMGNWEALGYHSAHTFPDVPGAAVAKRNSNPEIQRLAEHMRDKTGMATFYQDDSPRAAVRHLSRGGFLAVVPDQDMRALAGIFIPFFGHDAYTPTGPATLAVVTGSPMLVVTSYRDGRGRLRVESFEPIRPIKGANRHEEVERLTRAWSHDVEQSVRAHPADWMWFHQRWRTTPASLAARRERLQKQFHAEERETGT